MKAEGTAGADSLGQPEAAAPELESLVGRDPKRIFIAVAGWTMVAVITSITAFISMRGRTFGDWFSAFRPMLTYYYLWGLISVVMYRIVVRFPFSGERTPWVILLHISFFALITTTMPFLVSGSGWRPWLIGERAVGFHTLTGFVYLFVLTGCELLKHYRLHLKREREAREIELRASLLQNQLSRARIDTLKMQINPHFLFNALNSIGALIETSRNAEAYRTTELLGDLLRTALDQSRENLVPLRRELQFVEQYVAIEKVRFGTRLRFEVDAANECLDENIPALLLQPLVENAIKHAVMPLDRPVTIRLSARLQDERLRLEVADDGPGLSNEDPGEGGLGLDNVRQRLQLLFETDYVQRVTNVAPTGACVVIEIPRIGH